jgi:uncharacterized membrane protein
MDPTIIQKNYELRACSRRQLHGMWGSMALVFFVYFLILTPFYFFLTLDTLDIIEGYADPGTASPVTTILRWAKLLTSGAFTLGFTGYFLKRVRGEEISLKNIFDGFKHFLPALFLKILTFLFVILWAFLFIIPGIIKFFGYSMAYYILNDNPGITTLEAMSISEIMMKGYKFKLFALYLSFTGWFLLGLFTFGIGWLWGYPYMSLSKANFYENLKRTQEKVSLGDKPVETVDEKILEIARKLKIRGRPMEEIVEDTGLPFAVVENL